MPDGMQALLTALRDPGWAARVDALRAAAAALGAGKLDPVEEELLLRAIAGATTDAKWEVRKEAAVALAECRHHESEAQRALAQLAQDENRWVSQAADRAAKRMRSRASRAKEWALTPDAQDPTLDYILKRIREIGLRSMTPARIYELAMEVVEQSYRELAAETAHELRTLLTPIEGYLAELRRHLTARGADVKAEHMLAMALDRLRRIQLLTEDIREYSLQSTTAHVPVDVDAVIRDAVALGHASDDADPGPART
jgi:signal transduction histidine kinase